MRFLVAAAVLAAVRPRRLSRLTPRAVGHGAALGLAHLPLTWGLHHTSASSSGFITGLFVAFTPVLSGALLCKRVPAFTWLAAGVAPAGVALLSLRGFTLGPVELLTLVTAPRQRAHLATAAG